MKKGTICIAQKDENSIVVGTDSLVTCEDFMSDDGAKFLDLNYEEFHVAYAGSVRYAQLVERCFKWTTHGANMLEYNLEKSTLIEFTDYIEQELKKHIIKAAGPELPAFDGQLLVCAGNKIFEIDDDLAVYEHGNYACIGSSQDLGYVAMDILNNYKMNVETRVRKAIEYTAARSNACGGEVHIRRTIL